MNLTNTEILEILNLVRYELLMRDCNFIDTDRNLSATGLCGLIIQAYMDIHDSYFSLNVNAKKYIPEFTKESCNKIAPIKEDLLYWWTINTTDTGNYDVESRLKVINHFIELYSNRIDPNCIF